MSKRGRKKSVRKRSQRKKSQRKKSVKKTSQRKKSVKPKKIRQNIINKLPEDLTNPILSYLEIHDLKNLAETSKQNYKNVKTSGHYIKNRKPKRYTSHLKDPVYYTKDYIYSLAEKDINIPEFRYPPYWTSEKWFNFVFRDPVTRENKEKVLDAIQQLHAEVEDEFEYDPEYTTPFMEKLSYILMNAPYDEETVRKYYDSDEFDF
jgi:hypothetical protein